MKQRNVPSYSLEHIQSVFSTPKNLVMTNSAFQGMTILGFTKVDRLLPPDEIRRIRKKLHINQKEAGEYFGGGVNGFSRYERGESPPPKSLSSLFVILDKHF
jgi:putative zinc finger/helix-turn-helix YgiT family protein